MLSTMAEASDWLGLAYSRFISRARSSLSFVALSKEKALDNTARHTYRCGEIHPRKRLGQACELGCCLVW